MNFLRLGPNVLNAVLLNDASPILINCLLQFRNLFFGTNKELFYLILYYFKNSTEVVNNYKTD